MLMLVPAYSMKIFIGHSVMTTYIIPFVIGMLLARDSIVGISIPCSISLPASLFTRSVTHHSVITLDHIVHIMMMSYRVGPEIPLRLHGVTNPSLDSC